MHLLLTHYFHLIHLYLLVLFDENYSMFFYEKNSVGISKRDYKHKFRYVHSGASELQTCIQKLEDRDYCLQYTAYSITRVIFLEFSFCQNWSTSIFPLSLAINETLTMLGENILMLACLFTTIYFLVLVRWIVCCMHIACNFTNRGILFQDFL